MAPHVEDGYVPESIAKIDKAISNGQPTKGVQNGHEEKSEWAPPKAPLELKGVLNKFKSFDVTPVIGREFKDGDLAEWLRAPNSDELLRELAITSESILPIYTFPPDTRRSLIYTFSLTARRRLLPRTRQPR